MDNPKIKIKWLSDSFDCELCGYTYADGALVTLDEKVLLDLQPAAHCLGGIHWETDEVYKEILDRLGYELETE